MPIRPIRILIVDDSVFMRTMLKNALSKSAIVEVVGTAHNGQEALNQISELKPDVVTLDIEMPGLSGIDVLKRVMKESPLPVVMVSTKTQASAKLTFEALELGAVDYVAKPLADQGASLLGFQEKVFRAVETAFASNRHRIGKKAKPRLLPPQTPCGFSNELVVAIGISAGGPATLHEIIPLIPRDFPPIVLAQHMPASFTGLFAKRLDEDAQLTVKEAEQGDELKPGLLLIAPGDRHLRLVRRGQTCFALLDEGPKVSGFRPSVDVLFESVASACGANAIGLIMTGMGCDGANGIRKLKGAGAQTLAQDRESSIVYGMPKAAFDTGCVDRVVSLAEIPSTLVRMVTTSPASAAAS